MYHGNTKLKSKRIHMQFFFLLGFLQTTYALTVDNQLVSARNDCFERIALEAMLPFEKTFRTEDTNSLKMCKEKCLQAGEKCQAISFGVHRRGNGTCQLSTEQYGSSGGRPGGVIFDPDFDLYTRKTNCFDLSDNAIPETGALSPLSGYGDPPPTPTVHLPNRPIEGTPLLVVDPSPPTTGSTGTTLDERPPPLGPGSTPLTPTSVGDRLYFSHEIYPLYKYPMLYEQNYPAPNDDVYIPGGYAANVPEVEDRYRPAYAVGGVDDSARPTPHGPPRPIFGLGYGNGYSYGMPERYSPTTMGPNEPHDNRDRPSYAPRPGPPYPSERPDRRPTRPSYDSPTSTPYGTRPTYDGPAPTSYGPRPSYEPSPQDPRPDYSNRPDPPAQPLPPQAAAQGGYGSMGAPSMRPHPSYGSRDDYVRRNGSAPRPDGYDDDKTIATYFNPDDYMHGGGHKPRPMDYDRLEHDRLGQPPMDEMKTGAQVK